MYISSFNVNSINARINNLIDYLKNHPIDVILLQEIKSVEENFPYKTFEDLGYNIYAPVSYTHLTLPTKAHV